MRAPTDTHASLDLDAARRQSIQLLKELFDVEHDTIAEQAALARMQNARRNLVQDEFILTDMYGVAGVGAALIAGDDGYGATQHVDNFAFTFVAPLGTDDDDTIRGIQHELPLNVQCGASQRRTEYSYAAVRLARRTVSYKRQRRGFLPQQCQGCAQQLHGRVNTATAHVVQAVRRAVHAPQ